MEPGTGEAFNEGRQFLALQYTLDNRGFLPSPPG